ncbi:MAG TPA: DUF420 domain-containing protein [Thermoanaerobaculia bacterium]|nr:DUF420 domain-containing protein [Thermoanaerobaculia bacterium]
MGSIAHLDGPPAANVNLILQVAMGVTLLVGMVLARRRWFTAHRVVQTAVVLLNVVLVALVMAPAFHAQHIFSGALRHPRQLYFTAALLHAVVGTVAFVLGLYVVASAGTPILPERLRLRRYKPWMRATLGIWLLALLLGIATYVVWYGPGTAGAGGVGSAGGVGGVEVKLSNFRFTPEKVTIAVGDTVVWVDEVGMHSVVCDEEKMDSGPLAGGERFTHRFAHAGVYTVYCDLHGRETMAGKVEVVAARPP